jgi:hypothetical protein
MFIWKLLYTIEIIVLERWIRNRYIDPALGRKTIYYELFIDFGDNLKVIWVTQIVWIEILRADDGYIWDITDCLENY